MKTTLNIDDGVMIRLKQEAARQGKTMSELMESAIRRLLEPPRKTRALPDLPSFDGGIPRVNIANREALYDLMENP